ncbi:MAG: hypothetical protein KME52_28440 [Desmonostoc geniculatum HA4340-LM1]|jgi:uncharacterized protein YoxC|nr:hypothetical protein [Desmonostoc geniculatum HA4340-LM1]
MSLDNIKNKFYYVSFGLGIASTVALFVPNDNIKSLSKFGIGATIATLITSEVTTGKGYSAVREAIENTEKTGKNTRNELENKLSEIGLKQSQQEKLIAELEALKPINEQLLREINRLNSDVDSKREQLTTVQHEVQKLKNSLHEVGTFSTSQAFGIVQNTFRTAMKKLEAQVNSLHRNYPDCQEDLDAVLLEIERMRTRFLTKLEEYSRLETFEELLDVGLELQELIINQCIDLRVKAQTIVIRFLDDIVRESVPFADYETYITDLTNKAAHELHQAQLQRENDVKSIAQEWVVSNNGHKERYETNYSELLDTAKQAVNRLTEVETKLMELQKPLMMFGESVYANAANAIANYYYSRYQYLLDCITWEETETGYKVLFAIRRNPGLTEKELYADNSREQVAAFTNALHGTLPSFDFNRQNSTVTLDVTLRRATKKNELPRGVKTAEKFPTIVAKWKRVRITGGSESGKSPTAENMIVCILLSQGGTVDFYDPMHDSVKNYRTIPAVGKTHDDSIQGLKNYETKMAASPSDRLYLAWFDEIDTTLDKNPKSASDLKAVLKQSSHKNSGLVITGQNANVRNLKGNFDRSDMNNFVCVHIGDNYKDAVKNSNLSESEQDDLMKKGDALKDWCLSQNESNGLTTEDPEAYRFALVLEPNKKGYYILLPDFGTYTYDMVKVDNQAVETPVTQMVESTPIESIKCPHCGSNDLRKNGKDKTTGRQKYICKNLDCKHHFSE